MSDPVFNLSAYLARIGHAGSLEPGLPLLRSLILNHSTTIPFENIDVVLGRPIRIGIAEVQDKLVNRRRGGYCFEQNTLLQAALDAIGFHTTALLGRVVRGLPPDSGTPRGHMMLRVDLPEGPFLADVGFGNLTPTAPIALRPEQTQQTPHEPFRLMPLDDEWLLQALLNGTWEHVYRLSLAPPFPVDFEMSNWFTCTRPGGLFTENLVAARAQPDHRSTLFNGNLGFRSVAGGVDQRELMGLDAYRTALAEQFGLILDEAELQAVVTACISFGERSKQHRFF